MTHTTILQTIGNTPAVELPRYSPRPKVKIYAKLEGTNPGGSIKDRIALYMINSARRKGLLRQNREIIEATSGNTGIGLAMISAVYGYKFIAVLPESASIERRKLISAYGAKILLTDGTKGTNYALDIARQMVIKHPNAYIMLDQFGNLANIRAHFETTGVEILTAVPQITHFVAGMGTGGTLMGVGKRLKQNNRAIQVIGIEPLPGSKIQGLRNMAAYNPPIYKESGLDMKLVIPDDSLAFELARDLFKKEGISVGISSGAALWGAIKIAKSIKQGTIVTVFPDRGDKYASTALFP